MPTNDDAQNHSAQPRQQGCAFNPASSDGSPTDRPGGTIQAASARPYAIEVVTKVLHLLYAVPSEVAAFVIRKADSPEFLEDMKALNDDDLHNNCYVYAVQAAQCEVLWAERVQGRDAHKDVPKVVELGQNLRQAFKIKLRATEEDAPETVLPAQPDKSPKPLLVRPLQADLPIGPIDLASKPKSIDGSERVANLTGQLIRHCQNVGYVDGVKMLEQVRNGYATHVFAEKQKPQQASLDI